MLKYVVPDGMPLSVFNDRYARNVNGNGKLQGFTDRVREMVLGNISLDAAVDIEEREDFLRYAMAGITPLSGRHLQHGDDSQKQKNIEVFTNCSTAAFSFLSFYLLLNGSGVGRDYSSESCRVDWEYMPNVRVVLDGGEDDDGDIAKGAHPDFSSAMNQFNAGFDTLREAKHKYDSESEDVRWFKVRDSREGWAEVVAVLETAAFHRNHKDSLFIFDFSGVRPRGTPIKGMQNRPAQGPIPLMQAILKVLTVKGTRMKPWKQALFIDHYLAATVVMGNVRRCLPKGTLVHLKRGLVPIEDVQIGDFVLTGDGYHQVVDNLQQGIQEISTINTQMGQFSCTANHRVAVLTSFNQYSWKMAKDLDIGDRLVFVNDAIDGVDTVLPEWSLERDKFIVPTLTPEVAWFIGAIHGDGYVYIGKSRVYRRKSGINRDEYHDELVKKIEMGFDAFGYNVLDQPSYDNCHKLRATSKHLALYFHKYIKQPNAPIIIPKWIQMAKKDIRAAYLAGLLDTDGSVKTRPVCLALTVYKEFARQIQALYSSLGIPTRMKLRKSSADNQRDKWSVNLVGNYAKQKFIELVQPFAVKRILFSGVSNNEFGYPKNMVKENVTKYHGKWTDQSDQMTYNCAIRCGVDVKNFIPVCVTGIIINDEIAETYDLTVADRNEFVAEGLLVHNSARMATKSWDDRDVIEFIDIKRGGFLWSANDSILTDDEFWEQAADPRPSHARRVFEAAIGAAYYDETGEPGFINTHKLCSNTDGFENITAKNYLNPAYDLRLHPKTYEMIDKTLVVLKNSKYPFITNPCQPGWAPVLTKSGIRRLSDCSIGDLIWDGKKWTKITNKWSTGVKSVYRYRTTAGVFYGTENHRVVQGGKKIAAAEASSIDCARGEKSASSISANIVMDGLMIGDGSRHLTSRYKVYLDVGSADQEEIYRKSEIADLIGAPHPAKIARARIVTTSVTSDELQQLPERVIPDRFFHGDASTLASFLRGLYSANGSCNGSRITLKMTCARAVEQVQMMLSALGIVSYYTTNHPKAIKWSNGTYTSKESYDININRYNAQIFADKIGFIQPHKIAALEELLEKEIRECEQKKSFDIIEIEHVSDEEVFDITVECDEHVYWSGGVLVSNCGEIVLAKYGGYCVIGDVVLGRCESTEVAKRAVVLTTRALIRTNLMSALYQSEVDRTNRIGVGITAIYEYAWNVFGLSFKDLISAYEWLINGIPTGESVMRFWEHLRELSDLVREEAIEYSNLLGVSIPHSMTTIKPSGTISKVMACTEGAHLPPFLYYIRWVICEKNSAKHRDYEQRGYPIKDVSHQYHKCVVVGFPTKHPITEIVDPDKLLTAADVSIEDQFKWVILLERYWFGADRVNNQVSYTLKYDQSKVSHDQYIKSILEWQPKVRCCSVMPFTDESAYAYIPEERINQERYESLMSRIDRAKYEDYAESEIECPGGACPIEDKLR